MFIFFNGFWRIKQNLVVQEFDTAKEMDRPPYIRKDGRCIGCLNLNGWWCRGCGTGLKCDALNAMNIDGELMDDIIQDQFAGCDEPMVPCFACNRHGTTASDPDHSNLKGQIYCCYEPTLPSFWKHTELPGEMKKKHKQSNNASSTVSLTASCTACAKGCGWWARRDNKHDVKRNTLVDHGFTQEEARIIVREYVLIDPQTKDCWVPCYVCNQDGQRLPEDYQQAVIPIFWEEFSLENAVKNELQDTTDNPCEACGKLKGWWYCGVENDSERRKALASAGIDKSIVDDIMKYHLGDDAQPLVPCYLCNKKGELIGLPNKRKNRDPYQWRYCSFIIE